MLYIVDGTGDADDEVYLTVMSDGFCDRMRKQFKGRYFRGPTRYDWTISTESIANDVYKEIMKDVHLGKQPLFLAGHSRGGAAVIRVAQDLKKRKHAVDAMFLFDAVDRTGPFTRSVELIPSNVKVAYHARRDTSIANYFEWGTRNAINNYNQCLLKQRFGPQAEKACASQREIAEKYQSLDDAMKVRMRGSFVKTPIDGVSIPFGNCGTGPEDKKLTRYVEPDKPFLGSHGAIGGSPIGRQDKAWISDQDKEKFAIIADNDRAAMSSVWTWMTANFEEQRLKLHSGVRTEA